MAVNIVEGVALLVVNSSGRIYTVQEKECKPGLKEIGDFSMPMETMLPFETRTQTLKRLLEEECNWKGVVSQFQYLATFRIRSNVWLHGYYCYLLELQGSQQIKDQEVDPMGWLYSSELFSKKLRNGAANLLAFYTLHIPPVPDYVKQSPTLELLRQRG